MKLYFIFPMTGPNNGVKIISNHIRQAIFKNKEISIFNIDTAQATGYNNFGKFSFNKILFFLSILKKILYVKNSDYIYFNLTPKGYAFYRDLIILAVCRIKTPNVTVHVHANGLEDNVKWYSKFLFSKIKIIVINENQKRQTIKFCSNTFLVPNALPDYFKNKSIKHKINKDVNLIFLSNISKEKGVNRIIELSKILYNNNITCKLNIFGGVLTDIERDKIENLTNKYNFVKYYGPIIDDDKKFKYLLKNDVLLFLSDEDYEVYPLVYIEALMSGLPIITTNQIVAKNLCNLGVAQILNNDLSNFIEIIKKFANNSKEFKNFKERARKTYLENYSFENYIKKIEKIIFYDTRKSN